MNVLESKLKTQHLLAHSLEPRLAEKCAVFVLCVVERNAHHSGTNIAYYKFHN